MQVTVSPQRARRGRAPTEPARSALTKLLDRGDSKEFRLTLFLRLLLLLSFYSLLVYFSFLTPGDLLILTFLDETPGDRPPS